MIVRTTFPSGDSKNPPISAIKNMLCSHQCQRTMLVHLCDDTGTVSLSYEHRRQCKTENQRVINEKNAVPHLQFIHLTTTIQMPSCVLAFRAATMPQFVGFRRVVVL